MADVRHAALLALLAACASDPSAGIACETLTAVDGDSVRCDGELMRDIGSGTPHVSGYDTPELRTYKCAAERDLAQRAHQRMKELIVGATVVDTGDRDKTQAGRRLVRVITPDGRYAGDVLLSEGLAREWPGGLKFWC